MSLTSDHTKAKERKPPRVFISYSHDSQQHRERTLDLCDRLRSDGIDCDIDQYYEDDPPGNWPRWMRDKVTESDYVLVVCTEHYLRRFNGKEVPGKGLGASWEGAIITQELYNAQANNKKFIPVVFSRDDLRHIPIELQGTNYYVLDEDHESLLRRLTRQPRAARPPLGTRRALPPTNRPPRPAPNAVPSQFAADSAQEDAAKGWEAIRDRLSQSDEGRLLLSKFSADPEGQADVIVEWLRIHSPDMLGSIATLVTGGSVGKIINIANAGTIHID